MASIIDTTNLSYWSVSPPLVRIWTETADYRISDAKTPPQIPVAFVLAMGPRVYSGIAGPGKAFLDPQNPRKFVQNLEQAEADGKLDKEVRMIGGALSLSLSLFLSLHERERERGQPSSRRKNGYRL